MLSLTRRENQSIKIGDNITVYVTETSSNQVRLSIDAPKDVAILRDDAKLKHPKS